MAAPNVTANAADISVISAASRNTSRRGSLAAVLGVKYKTSGGPRRRSSNTLGATTASSQNDMLSATVLDHHHFSSDDEDENSSNQEDVYVSGMKLVHLYIVSRKKLNYEVNFRMTGKAQSISICSQKWPLFSPLS